MLRPKHFKHAALASAIAVALPAHSASADDIIEQAITVAPLVVYSDTYRNTATKSALAPEETPQGITIIDRDTLDMRGVDSVSEALRYVPGVTTELRGGAVTRMDLFTIRGFTNYQNMYDGLQLLFNDWNLQPQIDSVAIEQVEVFKGPTSVLYGSMPPGGLVNLIAKSPTTESYNSVSASLGNQDLKEASFETTGQIADSDFSYSVVGLIRDKDGQAVTSEEQRRVFAPSVDWQLTDRTLINFNIYYQDDPSAGIYNTVPALGSVYKSSHGKLPTDFYAGDANWNTYERKVLLVGYKINHEFNDDWTFLHNFRYLDGDAYQENTYNNGLAADNRTLLRSAYLTDEQSIGFTVDNQLSGIVRHGDFEHNLLFGVDYSHLESDIKYEDTAGIGTPSIDLYSPNNYLINPNSLSFYPGYSSDFEIHKEQTGIYFQDQLRINSLVLLAGGRYDDFKNRTKGRQYSAQINNSESYHNFSGRLGALYEFDNGLAPFVSYAESFEPVSGNDRHGNQFKPTEAHQWEAGIKYSSADDASQITLSAFQITKENDVTRDPSGGPYDQIQTGEVESKGIELEINSQVTDQLFLMFNYTWLDMEVTKDNSGLEGKTPVWVAEQTASLWANYDVSSGSFAGLRAGLGIRYIGETELDAANTDTVPSYTLVDLALSYDLGQLDSSMRGTTVSATANNVFDERYYSCYDGNNCWFGAERTVEATVKYEF
ncbi:ligand-gated channel protein [Methylophaga sp. 41_12_T18]|nr:ligand-gated channel protein [Methylophaga sp. 41_12_T18]